MKFWVNVFNHSIPMRAFNLNKFSPVEKRLYECILELKKKNVEVDAYSIYLHTKDIDVLEDYMGKILGIAKKVL